MRVVALWRPARDTVLPEDVLFEQIGTDVSSIQVADLTPWPDLGQTENSSSRDVGVFSGLDHDDQTSVDRD